MSKLKKLRKKEAKLEKKLAKVRAAITRLLNSMVRDSLRNAGKDMSDAIANGYRSPIWNSLFGVERGLAEQEDFPEESPVLDDE